MAEVLIRQYANMAGLALLAYDQVLTWEQEVQCIWLQSELSVKSSFLLSRYLALVIQAVNIVHSTPSVLQRQKGKCLPWLAFQTFAILLLLWNMEMIMMIRVYALYDQARLLGAFLVFCFSSARVLNLWNGIKGVTEVETDLFCIPKQIPNSTKWFGSTVVINQCLLWVLTFHKYRNAVKGGWSQHPIIRVVMRDNSWACIIMSGIVISVLPYSFLVQQLGHVIFCILNCAISIVSCRLILNMRSIRNAGDGGDQVELSTVLVTGEEDSTFSGRGITSI